MPEQYKKVKRGPIVLEPHALIGTASVVFPGVTLARGSSVGAMSLVDQNVGENVVVFGIPVRVIGRRDGNRLQQLAKEYLEGDGRVN